MFKIRNEAETIDQGFNFYPLKSNSLGFVFRIDNLLFFMRYSKIKRKFFFKKQVHESIKGS